MSRADSAAPALVFALRFFALAVVASLAVLFPAQPSVRLLLMSGIVAAAGLTLVQHAALRRAKGRVALWMIAPQALLWTLMVHATGGQASPLIVGYLLELPLSGILFARAGVALAGGAGVAGYLLLACTLDAPIQPAVAATVVGFLMLCAAIIWHAVRALERQQDQLEASRSALASRAESLSDELRLLGDYLGGALVGIDESGRIASLNPCGAVLLGIDAASARGKAWQEVLRPDPDSRLRILDTLDSGTPQRNLTMTLAPPSGGSITVRADVWLCPTSRDRRAYVLLEPAVAPSADDPLRRLGEAAACVAHQIKNSVHALQGFVRSLDRDAPGARVGSLTASEYASALQGLATLAEDVLVMGGASRPRVERVALRDTLRSVVTLLGGRAVRLRLPDAPLHAMANRGQLIHALFNLLDNALHASPPDRPVEVRATNGSDAVVVEITDAGPGIPLHVAAAAGPVASSRGAGLGLLAARRFVEGSGGRLSFLHLESGGTCCRLELPAAPATPG